MSRAAHYQRTSKAAQRHGVAKPKSIDHDESTAWMPEFISSLQGLTGKFDANSMIAMQLGAAEEDRVIKLRQLSKLGVLLMSARWKDGKFVKYEWELTSLGQF